ncbi:hypothetical protein [Zoogloea sp.]|uniref:nSTAND1 domain-containing NTPase n=1 Tax=Zoogloea sp. TaxID=49181 RepID=UPI00321FE991
MSDAPHSLLPADVHEPYIGLKPYTEAERDRFFGRERDAQLLINKLFSHPLTLLYAPSGVGKTSLLRALVIPELRAEEAQVVYFDKWNTPDPCDAVAQAVAGGPVAAGQGQLAEAARAALGRDSSTLVLVLDQFEEYLQRYAGDLGNLPAALGALLRSSLDLRVVLSFREEFLASVDACLRGHVLALFASTYHLEHLDRERAREAIAAPARRYGGECEEALVDRLLDDLAPGDPEKSAARLYRGGIELPFLQLICRCLWNKSLASGSPGLRMTDYLALGERRGIIAAYLHDVTRHFGLLQSLDAAKVLKALAPRNGVKIAYPLEALAAQAGTSEQRTERVLDVLREHRIVRTRDAAGGISFELQHDAFIEIVRPWAERRFRRRNQCFGGLFGVALLLAMAANVYTLRQDRLEANARRVAAEVTDRVEVDTRRALQEALKLAAESDDRNVRNTLRLAISGFLHNPALAPHKGAANGVAFSRDGAWIVSAGDDGEARLLHSRSLAVQAGSTHAGPVVAVAVSEDGSRVVSAGRDGFLRVWDRNGKVLTECGHKNGPAWLDADISRDGKRVVAIRESEDGTSPDLLLAETGGRCSLTRLSGHFGNVGSAAFDESGRWVLSYGNNDNTARIWQAEDGRLSATLTHPDEVFGASFSSDSSEVAVAVADGTVYRWTARGRLIGHPLTLPVQADQPPVSATSARYAPDGRRLVVTSSDGGVYVWDVQPDTQLPGAAPLALPGVHAGGALAAYFSPDGRRIMSYGRDDTLRVWDEPFAFRAREFRGHGQEVRAAMFAPDSARVVSAGADGTVKLWRLQPADFLPPMGNGLILSPSGRYSFSIASGELLEVGGATGRNLLRKGEVVRTAVFSGDARLIALGMTSGHLKVLPVSGGDPVFEVDDLESPLYALAFDRRGRRLASGGSDGRLRLYDLDAPKPDHGGIAAHAGPVISLDIHPDGERIVSTGADGAARVWSWSRQPLSTLEGEADRVRDARFSADGRRILRRNGDRITTFDGEAWARADGDLTTFARELLTAPGQ